MTRATSSDLCGRDFVLFDLDGTLADSLPMLVEVFYGFLDEVGVGRSRTLFDRLNGRSIPEIVAQLRCDFRLAETQEVLLARYMERLGTGYGSAVRAMPEADETLAVLRCRGYRLGLATAAHRSIASAFLAVAGWTGQFVAAAFGDEVARGKPAPDLFLLAMRRAGATPSETIIVEDSGNGVRAAVAAGAPVIGFAPNGESEGLVLAGAVASVRRLSELKSLLA